MSVCCEWRGGSVDRTQGRVEPGAKLVVRSSWRGWEDRTLVDATEVEKDQRAFDTTLRTLYLTLKDFNQGVIKADMSFRASGSLEHLSAYSSRLIPPIRQGNRLCSL